MQKRNLEELNLLDDFLMGSVLSYPGIGPEVCRRMVSIILNREIKQIRIIPQKVYFGADTDKHGIRLDVYAEEKADDLNTVYDIEPDKDGRESLRLALPKRARFYHAKIDADSLASGEDYGKLKNVIVIFICPYDPFQLNRMVYTIKSCCVEEPGLVHISIYEGNKRKSAGGTSTAFAVSGRFQGRECKGCGSYGHPSDGSESEA